MCAFNLPTQYNAPGQEYIKDDEEKVKIKLDPKKVQIDELTQLQVEEIVTGWVKYLNKVLQANTDKVICFITIKITFLRILFNFKKKIRNLKNTPRSPNTNVGRNGNRNPVIYSNK